MSDFHRITEEERNDTVNAGAVVEAIGIVLNRAVSFEFYGWRGVLQGAWKLDARYRQQLAGEHGQD